MLKCQQYIVGILIFISRMNARSESLSMEKNVAKADFCYQNVLKKIEKCLLIFFFQN